MAKPFAAFKQNGQILKITSILKAKIEPWQVEIGIIQDGPHRIGSNRMKKFAGGQARHITKGMSGLTLSQVSKSASEALGINYLQRPFVRRSRKNRDALRMMVEFYKLCFQDGKTGAMRRYENAAQAVVRNPLTRADYGRNKKTTAAIKGSNRKFIDTGQLFKAIRAKVRRVRRKRV